MNIWPVVSIEVVEQHAFYNKRLKMAFRSSEYERFHVLTPVSAKNRLKKKIVYPLQHN